VTRDIGAALVMRATTPDDFTAVHGLAERYAARIQGHPTHLIPPELASILAAPGCDPRTDVPLIMLDGSPVAWGTIQARPPWTELSLGYVIDPHADPEVADAACDALLRALRDVVDARVAALPPDPSRRAAVIVHEQEPHMRGAAAAHGFRDERHVLLMSIDQSAAPAPAPDWPSGVSVRSVTLEDAAVLAELSSDTFAEHPGDNHMTREEMVHHLSEQDARLDISLLATDEVGPVGLVLCYAPPDAGYIATLGVRTRARGRGLGTAMLRQAFRAFADDGRPVVRLHVEQTNTTGAIGVYENAGMRREYALQVWTRAV
jgi:mycothiol synthase